VPFGRNFIGAVTALLGGFKEKCDHRISDEDEVEHSRWRALMSVTCRQGMTVQLLLLNVKMLNVMKIKCPNWQVTVRELYKWEKSQKAG